MDIRLRKWIKLLDIRDPNGQAQFKSVCATHLAAVPEARVIEQDVVRTRANEIFFSDESIRELMKNTLLRYCAFYKVEYMQGLNEILAPLLTLSAQYENSKSTTHATHDDSGELDDPDVIAAASMNVEDSFPIDVLYRENDFSISLVIFERLLEKLSPVIFVSEGVQALQAQLASFHLLLYYYEADLSAYLSREGMTTDVYAQSWFITLFARRSPVHIALYLWDLLLLHNKPSFIILMAVAFMQKQKNMLMSISPEILPSTLVRMNFQAESEIDEVYARALELETSTPASALHDIHRYGFDITMPESERASGLNELMFRPCLLISADDVASALMSLPSSETKTLRSQSPIWFNGNRESPTFPKKSILSSNGVGEDKFYSAALRQEQGDSSSSMASSSPFSFSNSMLTSIEFSSYTLSRSTSNSFNNSASSPPAIRYLLIDCRQDHDEQQRFFIEGSLIIRTSIVEEICRAAQTQQISVKNEPNLEILSPIAAATLALLWSCRGDDIHFAVFGSDTPRRSPSPVIVANTASSATSQVSSSSSSSFLSTSSQSQSSSNNLNGQSNVGMISPIKDKLTMNNNQTSLSSASSSSSSSTSLNPSFASSSSSTNTSSSSSSFTPLSVSSSSTSSSSSSSSASSSSSTSSSSASSTTSTSASSSSSSSTHTGNSSPAAIAGSKRRLYKQACHLPCHQLATALLVLGFSKVSVIKGAQMPIDCVPELLLPSELHELIPCLRSGTDGFSALVYSLYKLGETVTNGVVHVPQDAVLAHKVSQFSLSERQFSSVNSQSSSGGSGLSSEGSNSNDIYKSGSVIGNEYSREGDSGSKNKSSSSISQHGGLIQHAPKGMVGLEGMLRRLGGLQEGFVETVLLPHMQSAMDKISAFSRIYDGRLDSSSKPPLYYSRKEGKVQELLSKIKLHCEAQSLSSGKTILKEVKQATCNLSPMADDFFALKRKFNYLRKSLESIAIISSRGLKAVKILTRSSKSAARRKSFSTLHDGGSISGDYCDNNDDTIGGIFQKEGCSVGDKDHDVGVGSISVSEFGLVGRTAGSDRGSTNNEADATSEYINIRIAAAIGMDDDDDEDQDDDLHVHADDAISIEFIQCAPDGVDDFASRTIVNNNSNNYFAPTDS